MAAASNGDTGSGVDEKRQVGARGTTVCQVGAREGHTCSHSSYHHRFGLSSVDVGGSSQTTASRRNDGVGPTTKEGFIATGRSELSHVELDKGWAWVIAFAVMFSLLITMGSYRCLSVLIVELMGVYDEPAAEFGFILFWHGVGFSVSAVINIAGIGEVVHERALMVTGGVVLFAGFMCAYFSSMLKHFYILGFCIGASTQLGTATGFYLIGQYFKKRLALANGIAEAGVSLGSLVFPPTLQVLFMEFSYRGSCLIMAAIVLNLFVAGGLLRPSEKQLRNSTHRERETRAENMSETKIANSNQFTAVDVSNCVYSVQSPEVPTKAEFCNRRFCTDAELEVLCLDETSGRINTYYVTHSKLTDKSSSSSVIRALKKFAWKGLDSINGDKYSSNLKSVFTGLVYFKDLAFTFFQISFLTATLSSECLVQFYPAFVNDVGISKEETTYLLTLLGSCDIVGRVVTGCLGDCMSRSLLVIIAQTILGGACLLSMFATSFWSQVPFATSIGLLYGVNYTFRFVILIDYFGLPDFSRIIGISNLLSGLGYLGGGPIVGFLRDYTGSYSAAIQLLGGCFISSTLCMVVAMSARWCRNRRILKSRACR